MKTTGKTSAMVILVIGLGLFVASLFADIIGIGDDAGFGGQQTMGSIVGIIIVAVGFYLSRKATKDTSSG